MDDEKKIESQKPDYTWTDDKSKEVRYYLKSYKRGEQAKIRKIAIVFKRLLHGDE